MKNCKENKLILNLSLIKTLIMFVISIYLIDFTELFKIFNEKFGFSSLGLSRIDFLVLLDDFVLELEKFITCILVLLFNPTTSFILLGTYGLVFIVLAGLSQAVFDFLILIALPSLLATFIYFKVSVILFYIQGLVGGNVIRHRWNKLFKHKDKWYDADTAHFDIEKMPSYLKEYYHVFSQNYYELKQFISPSFSDYIFGASSLSEDQTNSFLAYCFFPRIYIFVITMLLSPSLRSAVLYYLRPFVMLVKKILIRYDKLGGQKKGRLWVQLVSVGSLFITPIIGLVICHFFWSLLFYCFLGVGVSGAIIQSAFFYFLALFSFLRETLSYYFIKYYSYKAKLTKVKPVNIFFNYISLRNSK